MARHLIIKIFCICLCIIMFPFSCMAGCPCDNLTEVTSQDDLFRQIYETALDDDCMFRISSEYLQEKWKIPVIEITDLYDNNIIRNKYYKNGVLESRIGLYIVKLDSKSMYSDYRIVPTSEYMATYKTIFPDGHTPKLLPPVKRVKPKLRYREHFEMEEQWNNTIQRGPNDFFQPGYNYYWECKDDGRRRLTFGVTGGVIRCVSLIFSDYYPPEE